MQFVNIGLFDLDGNLMEIQSVGRDITVRKQAEEALWESEEKFRSFAEQSFVGIYLISGDVFKYVNPKFAEIFGYSIDECLDNMRFPQLVHPEDLAAVEKQVGRRLTGETKTVRYSFRGIKKGGETIHVEIFGSSMVLKGKTVVTGTMLNITERKQAEKALRESEEKYRTTLRSTPDTVAISRVEDGRFLELNDGFTRMFGYPREEAIGKTVTELGLYHLPTDRDRLVEALSTQEEANELEFTYRRKDGTLFKGSTGTGVVSFHNFSNYSQYFSD